jgi:hypothetical protein
VANNDANSLLMGAGKHVKFSAKGDGVIGVIVSEPTTGQQRDFDSGEPATWPDGQPKMQIVVKLKTQDLDPDDDTDDGERTLYIDKPNMRKAIAAAVKKAGRKGLAIGGVLSVHYTADGERAAGKKGGFPPKLFEATYVAPTANEVAVEAPKPEPKAEAPAAPSVPGLPGGLTPEALQALQALGLAPQA